MLLNKLGSETLQTSNLHHLIFEQMHRYFIKTPGLIKKLFSHYTWEMPAGSKSLYLTFDDGPHPTITPWVLGELEKWNARATFFCIGKNVLEHTIVYDNILRNGHTTGNHTFNHLDGWYAAPDKYVADVAQAASLINSSLFRPPYGRIRSKYLKSIKEIMGADAQVIMWDVLSADFDKSITAKQCLKNVLQNVKDGSIIVFHDSEKAFDNLRYVLPVVLQQLTTEGYVFRSLKNNGVKSSLNN